MTMHISGVTIRHCHKCGGDIWRGMPYWNYNKDKVICQCCARPVKTYFQRIMEWVK